MAKLLHRRPRRKKAQAGSSSGNYFTHQTELSIIKFQKESNLIQRKKIFVEEIRPALVKLIENIIFVYNFHAIGNIDVLKNDCLSFLFESLEKFDGTRGHKAFSYFNVISKNWFSQHSKNFKKRSKSDVHLDNAVLTNLEKQNDVSIVFCHEEEVLKREWMNILKKEMKGWRSKFEKTQEKQILEAIIILFENPEILPLYNKKGIYMYLREISGLSTKQVVTNLIKFKKKYEHLKARYLAGEV